MKRLEKSFRIRSFERAMIDLPFLFCLSNNTAILGRVSVHAYTPNDTIIENGVKYSPLSKLSNEIFY